MVQEQYWNELYQLKTHINVVEYLLEKAEKADRIIKIVLAITSSVSIGSWAIWNQYSYIWAIIIAGSQIISAIVPYLPYTNRIKSYSSLIKEWEELMILSEFKWYAISNGELTKDEINNARFEIKKFKQKSLSKYIQTTIPFNKNIQNKAEELACSYLKNYYG